MSSASVLLFEPDPQTRLLVAEALRGVGHLVIEVGERNEAVDLIHEGRFEIVVAAVGASDRTGLELAAMARRGSKEGSVVALFLVDREALAAVAPMLSSPLTDFIVKPVDRESIEARLAVTGSLMEIMHEASERKRLESRLVVADRMASLGTLAAGVAHEINNPLSYVMANVSHVASEIARRATEANDGASELSEALDEALVGIDRIRKIVADLKTFSRPDDDQAGVIDVRRALDSSVNMAGNEVRHRARLIKEYGAVPLVRGSEARLGQVFLNLLVNAAQAMPVGQASKNEIRLRTSQDPTGNVLVEVADTGPGIAEDVLRRIFDPFFTTKPVGEGTGLGLAICHAIVKALGGDISVESVVGEGTTVRVSLPPATLTTEEAVGRRLPREPAAPKRRILVIDDERLFAAAVRRMLQAEHEVTLVESGREAIGLLSDRDFDLVLCDLMMPEVTGMDVYNEVRRARPGYETRMVFMTGGAFTSAARQFLEAIPNERLDKPFTKDEIRAVVRRLTSDEPRGSRFDVDVALSVDDHSAEERRGS